MENKVYFSNVQEYGNLVIDYIFNEYEQEPVLFTLKDTKGNFFISVCYEMREKKEWLVSKVTIQNIIDLINKEIDIYSCFHTEKTIINIIGDKNKICDVSDIDEINYPKKGIFLRPGFSTVLNYLYSLIIKNPVNNISFSEKLGSHEVIFNNIEFPTVSLYECAKKYDENEISRKTDTKKTISAA